MTYIISTLWIALTSVGLLMDDPAFNIAVASTILIVAILIAAALLFTAAIGVKRYDAIQSIPRRNVVLRWISTIVDCSPGIAIASIGHPVLGAAYLCLYGAVIAITGLCKAIAENESADKQ
ncbi:hypothetical protein [Carnimonas bestiolae]|uniref:hypothetical protein n=1 Tax=Carnimonas bestiolae TaxID=3402172 RepID=UPI003EDBA1F4